MADGTSDSEESSGQVGITAQCDCLSKQFDLVIERNHQVVFRYAYRLTGCATVAEDITQEVFLKAFRAAHQLREMEKERSWLLAITRNEFVRWLRNKRHHGLVDESNALELADPGLTGQAELDNQDWIEAALKELSEEFRSVLLMYYFEELSYAEIAEQLSIPIGTVMSRLNRGRSTLRRFLDQLAIPK